MKAGKYMDRGDVFIGTDFQLKHFLAMKFTVEMLYFYQ